MSPKKTKVTQYILQNIFVARRLIREETMRLHKAPHKRDVRNGVPQVSVRDSVRFITNVNDIDALSKFAEDTKITRRAPAKAAEKTITNRPRSFS